MEHNIIIEFLASETFSSFPLHLIGTLFGAFVGFWLVINRDRNKKKKEKEETRNLIIDSLVAELQENLNRLNKFLMPSWSKDDGKFKGYFELAPVYAFQSIVNGGDFLVLPIKTQTGIREIYQNCELFNKFVDDIIQYSSFNLANTLDSMAKTELRRRLLERKTTLQATIPDSIKELKTLRKRGKIPL